jgi:hypothetical protein
MRDCGFAVQEKIGVFCFFALTTACFCTKLIITLVFEKKATFSQKIGKIAQNCDHWSLVETFGLLAIGRRLYRVDRHVVPQCQVLQLNEI